MGYIRVKDKIEYPAYAVWFDPSQELKYNDELDIHLLQGQFNCCQAIDNNIDVRLWDCNGIAHGQVRIINQKEYGQGRFEYTILKEVDSDEYLRHMLFLGSKTNESHRQAFANTFSTINSLVALSHLEAHLPMRIRHTNMKKFRCYGRKVEIELTGHDEPIVIAIMPFMRPIIFERLIRDMKVD